MFYWEFANFLRKIIVVTINTLVPVQDKIFIILSSLSVIFIFWRLSLYLNPYKIMFYNQLERREMICSIVTLFCTFVFLNDDVSMTASLIIFSLLMIFNVWFWGAWIYLFYMRVFPKRLIFEKPLKFLQVLSIMKPRGHYGDDQTSETTWTR